MMISEETISQVRNASDIVEVVSEFVPNLKRSGKDFKAHCPFHQEKTPSFMVSPSKGIFHCFGCGAGGDVFKFVMQMENCSYPEAIQKLAERKGITIHKSSGTKDMVQHRERRKSLLLLLERAMQFYHKNLMESADGKSARDYLLKKRGLKLETIEKFALGWAPGGGTALLSTALKAGFSESDLAASGLIISSHRDGKWADWFRKRIVFPIFDVKGQVIAFGGRILDTEKWIGDSPPPKYLNSPETEVFQKGRNLYGLFHGSRMIRERKEILVVEGYLDVISCHQAGAEIAVAPLGTSLTTDQCQLLKRYADQVTLLFDSDRAGDSATARGAELLIEFGFLPMVIQLPECKDADEYLQKHSIQEFNEVLSKKISIIEQRLQSLLKLNQDAPMIMKKALAVQTVMPLILKISNDIVQSEMLKLISRQLNISMESLYAEFKKIKNSPAQRRIQKAEGVVSVPRKNGSHHNETERESGIEKQSLPNKPKQILTAEEELLALLVTYPELRDVLKHSVDKKIIFTDSRCIEVCEVLKREKNNLQSGELLSLLNPLISDWLSGILFRQIHCTDPRTIFDSIVKQLEKKSMENEWRILGNQVLNQEESVTTEKRSRYHELTHILKGSKK